MKHEERRIAARILVGAAVSCLMALGARPAAAAIREVDIAAASRLELLEKAASGSYQSYSISIVIAEGTTTLTTNKDGERAVLDVPVEKALSLWRKLLDAGLEDLKSASADTLAPDASEFTLSFRVGEARGGFTASGVDSLADTRYREIIREILKFADKRVAGARDK
jgi:hypothetical protein